MAATGKTAGAGQISVFTTGRKSAFGSKPMPTVKLATKDALFARMTDDMNMNRGEVL